MSSTDETGFSTKAQRFFEDRLMPAAAAARAAGRLKIVPGPEPELDTYYVLRSRRRMAPADFELTGLDSPAGLADGLAAFWRQESPELAELAGPLAELATEARGEEEQTEEVSPFIYVMF